MVISKNKGKDQEEDYIDLVPILENLLIDPVAFLNPIKEVKIRYAGEQVKGNRRWSEDSENGFYEG